MAVHKGNRMEIFPEAGKVIPTYRQSQPTFPASVFELVGGTSVSGRSIMREMDAAPLIWAPVDFAIDALLVIEHPVLFDVDLFQWISNFIEVDGDTSLGVYRFPGLRMDTSIAVYRDVEGQADGALLIVHPVDNELPTHQTVFAVLINETHVIET